eukprot:6203527-Prymnesium_polylepis.1
MLASPIAPQDSQGSPRSRTTESTSAHRARTHLRSRTDVTHTQLVDDAQSRASLHAAERHSEKRTNRERANA